MLLLNPLRFDANAGVVLDVVVVPNAVAIVFWHLEWYHDFLPNYQVRSNFNILALISLCINFFYT
jgi:hypothetical protein